MKKTFSLLGMFALPAVAFAQTVQSVLSVFKDILNALIPILITAALVAFFYGLAKYILSSSDTEGKVGARKIMVAGLVSLFIMVSIWGIIQLFANTFGIGQGGTGAGLIPKI